MTPQAHNLGALGELARVVYKQCRDCNGWYRELSADAQQLLNIIEDLKDAVNSFELDEATKHGLLEREDTCNEVLVDLNTNLTKYKYMGVSSGATPGIHGSDDESKESTRTELKSAVTLLSDFYENLVTSTFIRVQKSFNQYAGEIRSGARDGKVVANLSVSKDHESSSSWLQVRQELQQLGLTSTMVDDYREYLIGKLVTLPNIIRFDGGNSRDAGPSTGCASSRDGTEDHSNPIDVIPAMTPQSSNSRTSLMSSERSPLANGHQTFLPPPYSGRAPTDEHSWTDAPQVVQPGLIPAYTDLTTPMRSMSINAPEYSQQSASNGQRSYSVSATQSSGPSGFQGQRSQSVSAPQVVQGHDAYHRRPQTFSITDVRLPGMVTTAYENAIHAVKGNEQQIFAQAAFIWNQRRYTEAMQLLPLAYLSVDHPARALEMCALARHCSAIHASYVGEFAVAKLHFLENVNHLGGPRSNNERCHELRVVGLRWLGDTCLQLGDASNALFVWALAIEGYSILASRNIKPWDGISKSLLFEFPRVLDYEKDRFRFQPPNTFVFPEFSLQYREHALASALQTVEHIKKMCTSQRKFRTSESNFNDFTRPPTSRTPFLYRSGPPIINISSDWFGKVLICDPFLDMENTISLVLHKQPRPGSGLQYSPWTSGEVTVRTMKDESLILNIFYQELSKDMASGLRLIGLRIVPDWNRVCCFATIGHQNLVAMSRLTVRIYRPMQKKSEAGTKFCIEYSYNTTEPSRPMAQPRSPTHESAGLEPWFKKRVETIASTMV